MRSLGMGPFDTRLSSAGLVYAHFGLEVIQNLLQEPALDAQVGRILFENLYEKFVQEIDAVDNGIPLTDQTPRYVLFMVENAWVAALGKMPE